MTSIVMTKIISIKDVTELTGLSRSTIYEMVNPRSKYFDASFPKKVSLTINRVGWVASEINQWIESRIALRDQQAESLLPSES